MPAYVTFCRTGPLTPEAADRIRKQPDLFGYHPEKIILRGLVYLIMQSETDRQRVLDMAKGGT